MFIIISGSTRLVNIKEHSNNLILVYVSYQLSHLDSNISHCDIRINAITLRSSAYLSNRSHKKWNKKSNCMKKQHINTYSNELLVVVFLTFFLLTVVLRFANLPSRCIYLAVCSIITLDYLFVQPEHNNNIIKDLISCWYTKQSLCCDYIKEIKRHYALWIIIIIIT